MSKDALSNTNQLPDDPVLLKQQLLSLQQLFERFKQEASQQIATLAQQHQVQLAEQAAAHQAAIDEAVQAAVLAILRRYYGPRSEKFDPRQLLLFGQDILQAPLDTQSIEQEAGEKLTTRRVKRRDEHGRQTLPEHLERIEIEHDLPIEKKSCPACGCERCRIGSEVSEQLEYFPASFKVLKHIRHKYACQKCDHDGYNPNIITAKKPPQPIERGLPGPSLLAYVIVSKLGDHLPLYRLEGIFARQQVTIARSTMCAWMRAAGELVQPLVALMKDRILQAQVIHTDDTTVPIQSPGQPKCRTGRIWCYLGDEANPYTVYDYTPNRKRDGPQAWLSGYKKYLQADAYGGYDGIFAKGAGLNAASGAVEVACWAHARRKFYDAQDSDQRRATQMLALIGELYSIERELKEACAGAWSELSRADQLARIATERQERSVSVLARIKTWLDTEQEQVLPRSPMAAAITYAQNQWQALTTYTTAGFLNIDNNAAERALKRVAIGRKNWLFAGNDAAAQNHARLWSLLASAERHGLDPQAYLTSVLAKIGQTPSAELDQFLPDVWKAGRCY
jgi:transposase